MLEIFERFLSYQIKNVVLNGDILPWVESAKHLGNPLTKKVISLAILPKPKLIF